MDLSAIAQHWEWMLLAFFLTPIAECVMAIIGSAYAKFGYVQSPGTHSRLIIQITTVGKEPQLVQRTVDKLRSYGLTMPYEIWVVIEPGMFTDYVGADEVIVVPAGFECRPVDKARALEYSRLIRRDRGLNTPDVKILLVDDDTLPSRRYVELAFNGHYDICQGVTVPSRWYAVGGGKHFVLSHFDDIRTRNCLVYCSCTQGLAQFPLYVHGEGLCITGLTEEIVTWDRPIVASDDLVFGTNAAAIGMSWGYFQAPIQLVSPWTFRESLNQRWRWTWGNIDAIRNREIMPAPAAWLKAVKYLLGFISVPMATLGAILLFSGVITAPPVAHTVFKVSLACWFFSYGFAAWVNAGGEPNRELRPDPRRFWSFRMMQALIGSLMTPVTALVPIVVITYSLIRGRPKRFIMITKSNDVMALTHSHHAG